MSGKGDVPIVILQFQKIVWIVVEKEIVDVFTRFVDERKTILCVGAAFPIVLHASDDDALAVDDKRRGFILEKRDVRVGKKFEDGWAGGRILFGLALVVVVAETGKRWHGLRQQLEVTEREEIIVFVLGHDAKIASENGDVRRMWEGEIKSFVEAFDSGAVVEMRVRNVEDAQRLLERNAEVLFFHFNALYLDGCICFVHTFDPECYYYEMDLSFL